MTKQRASCSSLQCNDDSGHSSNRTQSPYVTDNTDVESFELTYGSETSSEYKPSTRSRSDNVKDFAGHPTAYEVSNAANDRQSRAVRPGPTLLRAHDQLLTCRRLRGSSTPRCVPCLGWTTESRSLCTDLVSTSKDRTANMSLNRRWQTGTSCPLYAISMLRWLWSSSRTVPRQCSMRYRRTSRWSSRMARRSNPSYL